MARYCGGEGLTKRGPVSESIYKTHAGRGALLEYDERRLAAVLEHIALLLAEDAPG